MIRFEDAPDPDAKPGAKPGSKPKTARKGEASPAPATTEQPSLDTDAKAPASKAKTPSRRAKKR